MEPNELHLEAQDLNQQGAMLLRTGNLDAAKAKFDKAIELDPRNYLYAKLTGDPVRISRSERIDQPVCRLYDFQGLNIQERTPPSAYFGNSILT